MKQRPPSVILSNPCEPLSGKERVSKVEMLAHPAYAESQPRAEMENLEIGQFPRMFLKRITSRVLVPLLSCGRRIEEIRLRIKAFKELER